MGIDALLRELRERSRQEEAEIRREAEDEAERIVEEARREAGQERRRALRQAEQELRDELRAEREREENRVREQVMEARAELLERVRSRVLELLDAATDSEIYRRQLPGRIREARSCLPEDREVVLRCPPSLEEPIREALAETAPEANSDAVSDRDSGTNGEVRVETDGDVGAGFRATTPGGTITADATLARHLERDWSELTPVVLEELEERWAETGDR